MTRKQTDHGMKPSYLYVATKIRESVMSKMWWIWPYICSGFGFVTFKTVEGATRAIDDPQKMLGVSGHNFVTDLCAYASYVDLFGEV